MLIYGIIFPRWRVAADVSLGSWKIFRRFFPSLFRPIIASAGRKCYTAPAIIPLLFLSPSLISFKSSFGHSRVTIHIEQRSKKRLEDSVWYSSVAANQRKGASSLMDSNTFLMKYAQTLRANAVFRTARPTQRENRSSQMYRLSRAKCPFLCQFSAKDS